MASLPTIDLPCIEATPMKKAETLKCLIVDDSAIFRKVVRKVVEAIPGVEVVGMASNGRIALDQIAVHKPDFVTLDLEMPEMDGLAVLKELKVRGDKTAAIMVSAFTTRGAKTTTSALMHGAFDFILKPNSQSVEMSVKQLQQDLVPKIEALRSKLEKPHLKPKAPAARPVPRKAPAVKRAQVWRRPDVIAIGVSTGGPQALNQLLPKLPENLPIPVVLVQHMPPMFTKTLADDLNKRCALNVVEASQGQELQPGKIMIAPGGMQMRVAKSAQGVMVQIKNDPPERNCKPSVDYLFRSVAQVYGGKSLGVILTGMGDDGTLGARAMKQAGAKIIAQDQASCTVYGMPKSIADNNLADVIAPLNEIHTHIDASAHGRVAV